MSGSKSRALPEGWEWKRLGDIAIVGAGGTPSRGKQEYWEVGTIPWVKISDISDKYISETSEKITVEGLENSSAKIFPKGTILISIFATLGDVGILNIEAACNQALAGIQMNDSNVNPDFLYYYLKTLKSYFESIGRGVAQNNINLTILKGTKIPLPPLPTQRRIVSFLEKADVTKRLRAQADELTERLLQSVFLEMFGDPVRNPKGWERRKLSAVSHINMGQSPPGESYSKNGMGTPLLNGPTEFGDTHPTTAQWTDKPTKICNIGDILFCVRGATAGRMNWADQRYCIGRGIAAIQSIPNLSDNRYLYQILLMNYERFQATGKGSTFINISSSELGSLIVPVPPLLLQQKFACIVEKVESMRQSQNQSKQQIEDLFSALMQKAFRGEI